MILSIALPKLKEEHDASFFHRRKDTQILRTVTHHDGNVSTLDKVQLCVTFGYEVGRHRTGPPVRQLPALVPSNDDISDNEKKLLQFFFSKTHIK